MTKYKTFEKIIDNAKKTYKGRSKTYAKAYHEHGDLMKIIFPDGVKLKTASDFRRFSLFNIIVSKMHRYSRMFDKGGHQDSMHDLGVYAFMLEEVDANQEMTKDE